MKDTAKAFNALGTLLRTNSGRCLRLCQSVSVYVHGETYLAARQGSEAVAEFQKILDHRGVVLNEAIVPLAHLARARVRIARGRFQGARRL